MKYGISDVFLLVTTDDEGKFSGMTDYHYHEQTELYFLLSGECRYFIGNTTYTVTQGQMVVIPSFMIHKTIYSTKKRNRTLISLKRDFLDFEPTIDFTKPSIYKFGDEGLNDAEILLDKIRCELETGDSFSEKMCRCHCFELFTLIARKGTDISARQKSKESGGESRTVEEITSYITKHYMDSITLSEMAKRVSLSEGHLSRLFKKITGLGFKEYLITVRILNAKQLLKETDLPVSRIAFDCGFNDSNYFSKMFHSASGCTPLQYRKNRENVQK